MSSENKIKRFNGSKYNDFEYDELGLFMLSLEEDADHTSKLISDKLGPGKKIMDATAGLGGNSISFNKHFTKVISIEKDPSRYSLLSSNLKRHSCHGTVLNDDFLNHLDKDVDVIFIDPPWGKDYKSKLKLSIQIDNLLLKQVTQMVLDRNRKVVWKLPNNYDLEEFSGFQYEKVPILNYILLFF